MGVLFGSLTSLFIGLSDLFLVELRIRQHVRSPFIMSCPSCNSSSAIFAAAKLQDVSRTVSISRWP